MNEPVRLRRGERYEACDDAVQDALFKGRSCRGCCPQTAGAAPLKPPRRAQTASFDGRRLSKVLMRYSWKE